MKKNLALALAVLLCLPSLAQAQDLFGSGRLKTEARAASGFRRVEMAGAGSLQISHGRDWSVRLTLDDNLQAYYEARVRDGILHLGFRPGVTVRNPTRLTIELTMPDLEGLGLSGACEAEIEEGFSGPSLELGLSGAGRIVARLDYQAIGLRVSGSGKLVLSGKAGALGLKMAGAGEIDTSALRAKTVRAEVSGASRLLVRAVESLDIIAAGASDLVYWGDPRLSQRLSGTSRIRRSGP